MNLKVIQSDDSTSGNSYAEKDLSGLPFDYYVQVDFWVPQATLDSLEGVSAHFSADVLEFDVDGLFLHTADNVNWKYWTDQTPGPPAGVFVADAWHTLLFHVTKDSGTGAQTSELSIDGSIVFSSYAPISPVSNGIFTGPRIWVAGSGGNGLPNELYYATNVRVGTTPGAADIFCSDFSSGDFIDWDAEIGTNAVIDDPLGTGGPSAGCGGPPVHDYTFALTPATMTVPVGGSGTTLLASTLVEPPDDDTTLSATGQPAGVTVSFSDNPISEDGGTSTVTVDVGGLVAPGIYHISISGIDPDGATAVVGLTLTVIAFVPGNGLHVDAKVTFG